MKRLEIDQPTVEHLFAGRNGIFSIPFYQRPYSWQEEQCAELWHDFHYFAFPNGRSDDFNPNGDFYFLGNVVTYPNENRMFEVVDGQQRITSLLLFMRALYEDLRETENGRQLGKCIWYFTEDGVPDMTRPRIESVAILESDKEKIKQILVSGEVKKGDRDHYANNYRFFRSQIAEFRKKMPDNIEKLAGRLLRNVYFTRMEANSEDQALQLFLTINDRGMALRIEDIFQAKLYETAKAISDEATTRFLDKWKMLDERCRKLFDKDKNLSPIEFAFLLYVQHRGQNISRHNLKKIYSENDYALLKSAQTLKGIEELLVFFATLRSVSNQIPVSKGIQRKAHVLFHCASNVAWFWLASYFFKCQKTANAIYDDELDSFLERAIAYLLAATLAGGGVGVFKNHNLAQKFPFIMSGNIPDGIKISEATIRDSFMRFYELKNFQRVQLLVANWWLFRDEKQDFLSLNSQLQIEHIFSKALANQREFGNPNNIELPGNLALLEGTLNRQASARSFVDKRKVYAKSQNVELKALSERECDFAETEILVRNQQMLEAVIALLNKNGFLLS